MAEATPVQIRDRAFLLVNRLVLGELGLIGYDDCLTRNRSRVRFSELVTYTRKLFINKKPA